MKLNIFKLNIIVNRIKTEYPKREVINQFVQFGGAIGGLFIWLTVVLPNILFKNNGLNVVDVLNTTWLLGLSIVFYIFFGFILGLLPALLTGWIVAQINVYRSYIGLLTSLVIGSFIGFTFLSVIELPLIIQILTGGVSAFITGLTILPKHLSLIPI